MMLFAVTQFEWLPLDTWIVVVGALSAMACALVGSFLVLRKMSMMGDAISHAVLPGLALAFLLTGSRAGVTMLIGAGVIGVLTAWFTEWIHRTGKVDQGAAMGVVFTVLFAIGLILIRYTADHVDLDPDCVLYGAIELTPLDTVRWGGWEVPRAALIGGGVLLLNALFVMLLYKELKISAFDPALATTLGINARLMHYLLMTLVAVTTVAAFESVGSILVIAMLIVPPAAAHLLTDRLGLMLVLSLVLAAASAALGHLGAIVGPGWVGMPGVSTSTAGMMAASAGLLFALAFLLAPRRGWLGVLYHRAALSLRIVREDLLGVLYRLEEEAAVLRQSVGPADRIGRWPMPHRPAQVTPRPATLARAVGAGWTATRMALWGLRWAGQISLRDGVCGLTDAGRAAAARLIRSHRLWETYFDQHTPLAADHIHQPAERLEHVTDAALQRRLAASLGDPTSDPHGTTIPTPKGP